MREFRSRVKAALRRSGMARTDTDDERPIEVRGLRIDPGKRTVMRDGEVVPTTYVEFEILVALARSPGRVFTRDMLLARVWGDSAYRDPHTIDVHIRHLREKIEVDPKEPEYLFTVRGVGYRFRDEEGEGALPGLRSLRNRLAVIFALIIVGALGTIYLSVTPRLEASLTSQRLDQVAADSRRLTPGVARYLPQRDRPDPPKRLREAKIRRDRNVRRFAEGSNTEIIVMSEGGTAGPFLITDS